MLSNPRQLRTKNFNCRTFNQPFPSYKRITSTSSNAVSAVLCFRRSMKGISFNVWYFHGQKAT